MAGTALQEIVNVIGFDANIAFMIACLPEAVHAIRSGHTSIPITVAFNVLIACALYFIYAIMKYRADFLTWGSSLFEIPCYLTIIWYYYFPRKQ